jgi:hypothetical protein
MGNYLQIDAKSPADRLMFVYGIHMINYELLKPFFQDLAQEEHFQDVEDVWLCIETFREGYRSRSREDPSVA